MSLRGAKQRSNLKTCIGFLLYSMAIIGNNTRQMRLEYLAERVEVLQKLTKKVCGMKVESFA